MKMNLGTCAKYFAVVICVFVAAAAYVRAGSAPIAAFSEEESPQANIFSTNCARCHGADGRANTTKGRKLEATDFTSDWNTDEARGIRIITKGKGDMPAFGKKLSPQQIKAVFEYVRGFKK